MATSGLDEQQNVALLNEIDSTRNLLAYGLRIVRTDALMDNIRDPILTVLSIGLERLYKLTLGLAELDRIGTWPSVGEMQKHGHGVKAMHAKVWPELRRRSGTNSYLDGLVRAVESDPVMPPLVDCLDMYGTQGRFYFLNQLGNQPQKRDSPQRYWIAVESVACESSTHLRQLRAEAFADPSNNAADAAFRAARRDHIALSIEKAWEAVAACGKLHRLGPTGDVFGREVHPTKVGRQ